MYSNVPFCHAGMELTFWVKIQVPNKFITTKQVPDSDSFVAVTFVGDD